MRNLPGTILSKVPTHGLEWVSDLEYFEGPIVSHFKHKRGGDYLKYWVDRDDDRDRWMIARVSENSIERLANRIDSLDQVITGQCQGDFVIFLDEFHKGRETAVLVLIDDIPNKYTPSEGAFLRPRKMPKQRSFPLFFETEGLSREELSEIPRVFSQSYNVAFVLSHIGRNGFASHPWRGGFSSMHFYQGLEEMVPATERSEIKKFHYASPGFIQFSLDRPTAERVAKCVSLVGDRTSRVHHIDYSLGKYIRDNELRDLKDNDKSWDAFDKVLISRTTELIHALDLPNAEKLIGAAARPFEAAQIARSIVRRLSVLARYNRRGSIRLPGVEAPRPKKTLAALAQTTKE